MNKTIEPHAITDADLDEVAGGFGNSYTGTVRVGTGGFSGGVFVASGDINGDGTSEASGGAGKDVLLGGRGNDVS
ncbi:MAG: hypothetical protein KDE15_06350 [Erythrobacter sp.]|nr:hypothetical protein [Erythrobacter sp.]